jgi:hypothetical protein
MPILTTSSPSPANDPMDITPTSASMPPPNTNNSSPQSDKGSEKKLMNGADSDLPSQDEMTISHPTGAAAAANQPTKVVQTAFIHKLYK